MSSASNMMRRGSNPFTDPFDDLASLSAPQSSADALYWAERVAIRDGTLFQGMNRVAAYFVTNVQISPQKSSRQESLGSEEKEKYESYITDQMMIRSHAHQAALNYLIYGRHHIQVIQPIKRYLSCQNCPKRGKSHEAPLSKVANNPNYKFRWENFEFHATCPMCGETGVWRRTDRRSTEPLRIKVYNPHFIEVDEAYDGDKQYIWKIDAPLRRRIKEGVVHELERTPWEIVMAIKNDALFRFSPGVLYSMTVQPLAGHDMAGQGLPPMMANFRLIWHAQVLRRFNEAIAADYIIPARVISPEPRTSADGQSGDPYFGVAGGQFVSFVNSMLTRRRRDPASWMVSPFPLKYQTLGGDAKQFAPAEMLDQAVNNLLNAMGIPAQLYAGDLTAETAPAALRLFEANWSHLVDNLNRLLAFVVDKVAQYKSWEPVDAKFMKVTHADDLNRQMAILQLMQARQVSASTAFKTLGLEFKPEQEMIIEEEAFVAERTRRRQEDDAAADGQRQMSQQAAQTQAGQPPQPAGQAPPAGGAAPGGGMPTDPAQLNPQDLMSYADSVARDLMTKPEAQRKAELVAMRSSDKTGTLVALVNARMDKFREDAKRSGGQQVLQQQFGGQAKAATWRRWPKFEGERWKISA